MGRGQEVSGRDQERERKLSRPRLWVTRREFKSLEDGQYLLGDVIVAILQHLRRDPRADKVKMLSPWVLTQIRPSDPTAVGAMPLAGSWLAGEDRATQAKGLDYYRYFVAPLFTPGDPIGHWTYTFADLESSTICHLDTYGKRGHAKRGMNALAAYISFISVSQFSSKNRTARSFT